MQEVVNSAQTGRDVSRRDFLTTAAAVGAGLALKAGAEEPAKKVPASDKLNVALVGFGAQGRVLLESLLRIETIRLVAIVDVWEYAREYGRKSLKKNNNLDIRVYENHEELIEKEKDLQAVVCATPDFWHAPVTNACLKAGLHVYCEKMMSNTIEGARSMVKTMQETGKLLQIGHQRRSSPRYLFALNRLVREAKICGRMTVANAQWNRAVGPDLGWPKKEALTDEQLKKYGFNNMHEFRNWRWFKKYGGGPLSDLGAHQIDIFNWWFDTHPVSVIAGGGLDYYKDRDWYDNAMVIYEYKLPEGTARAFYQVQTTTSAGGGYFEYFMGTEGSIKISENPKLTKMFRENSAPPWDEWINKNYLRAEVAAPKDTDNAKVDVRETAALAAYELPVIFNKLIHQPHLENFFNSVLGKAKLNCPADEAFKSELTIFKASEAIAARKMIEFSPSDFEV